MTDDECAKYDGKLPPHTLTHTQSQEAAKSRYKIIIIPALL